MIFSEKKENNTFVYNTSDVFGEMEFVSPKRLDGSTLDQIFLAIFNIKSNTEIIEGTVESLGVSYLFKKSKQWDDVEVKETVSYTSGYVPPKPKRKMPTSLKRYWHRQDMGMVAIGLIIGALIVAITWLISLNK